MLVWSSFEVFGTEFSLSFHEYDLKKRFKKIIHLH